MITERSDRHPVDRLAEEFVALYRRGERPSIAEYAGRYPDLAAELEELLTALVLMEEHGPAASGNGSAADCRVPDRLGEYRILREIGRGGMGVVYEAIQESLGRHVALKVLPAAARMDPIRLRRFQREGQAAARLHHTNIVPVFGVGESDGVRYYAMQFIPAQSFDKVIDEVRALRGKSGPRTPPAGEANTASAALSTQSDSPRYYQSVARLGVQVAGALAHAHAQGVLHRDIKPANLLLDARGTAWVTDFGLATGAGMEELTQTGDVVGTLRYLAPERLHGQGDARADVYSLGLTLYELLTLRPAFDAPDRAALVRQIADAHPPRPRRLDPRIPRDLETIVLKACAKEPSRRYATAAEVADDLRRFLGNRPIEARRTPVWEQAWRWCRRNPGVATGTATALAALLVGLGVSVWQWRRADDSARQAGASAAQAEKDFELAFQAVDQMLDRVGFEYLEGVPHMDRTRRALLQDAVRFYQTLLREREDHPKGRLAMARAHWRLGQILGPLGDGRQAVQNFDRALGLVQAHLRADPEHAEARRLEAAIHGGRGAANHHLLGRPQAAEADYRQALVAWDRLQPEQPAESDLLAAERAHTMWALAVVLNAADRLPEAEASARQSIELAEALPATHRDRSRLLANGLNTLAVVLQAKGELSEGERVSRRAVPFFEESARENPSPSRRYELALALRALAQHDMRSPATRPQAEKSLQRSLRLSERLAADFPDVPLHRDALAATANLYGGLLDLMARPADARPMYDRAATIWTDLVSKWPDAARYRVGLGGAIHNLAGQTYGRGDLDGARTQFEEAIAHQDVAVRLSHREPNALEYLGNHYRDLVTVLVKMDRPEEADEAADRQLAAARELAAKDGEWPGVRTFQARAWEDLGRLRHGRQQLDEAAQAFAEAGGHRRRLAAENPNSPDLASALGAVLNDWARVRRAQRRWPDVAALADEAVGAHEAALRLRPAHDPYQKALLNHHWMGADARVALGDHAAVARAGAALSGRFRDRLDDYWWGHLLVRCVPLAEADGRLPPGERSRLAGEYADQAMAFLQAAQRKKSKDLPRIHTLTAFGPLRGRPDFQQLLASVPKPVKKP